VLVVHVCLSYESVVCVSYASVVCVCVSYDGVVCVRAVISLSSCLFLWGGGGVCAQLDLSRCCWRLRDEGVFKRVLAILRARFVFNDRIWAYAFLHSDFDALRELVTKNAQSLRYAVCVLLFVAAVFVYVCVCMRVCVHDRVAVSGQVYAICDVL
jgi:hypothetical protein